MADLTPDQKLEVITANLQESLDLHLVKEILEKNERPLKIYWGTAPTGRPHCGYFVPMMCLASFLRAGCNLKILLADRHAVLDNEKAPKELVAHRSEYYRYTIRSLLRAVGVPLERLEFVLGSSYQYRKDFQDDMDRLKNRVTIHDARKAGSEVVKQVENAVVASLEYPIMQALDEQYLDVDAQFGGVDQRKIFVMAKDILPKIGYKERAHFMNPMVPGLTGGKMSASDPDSKIDLLDPPEVVAKKLKKAFAPPKEVEGNGVLSFAQSVLMPLSALRTGTPRFEVERRDAEPLVYESVDKLHADYRADVLTPQLLKAAVGKAISEFLAPVQKDFHETPDWQEVEKLAYPAPGETEEERKKRIKKEAKKNKDKGSRAPGAVSALKDLSINGEANGSSA